MLNKIKKDKSGHAMVEAAILFPIIFMIFFAMVLLAMYLPTRAVLQNATQYAATALASETGDTWLSYDQTEQDYVFANSKNQLDNVYVDLVQGFFSSDKQQKAEAIVTQIENASISGIMHNNGNLDVQYGVVNYVIYQEVVVTATRTIPVPVNFSFIGFPATIPITVSSTAVVQNGDEFIRNMDIAVDLLKLLKLDIGQLFEPVNKLINVQ